MEDGVTETYGNLVSSENNISTRGEEDERGKERVAVKEGEDKKEQPSNGGVISNLISVLVSRNSEDDQEENGGGVGTEDRKREEAEKEGGIINHLISNLVSPLSPNAKEDICTASDQKEKSTGVIFNNLISGILHGGVEDHEKDEASEPATAGGGGGLIDNLVSHLPTPLAEDVEAPATDEASILIHSIVHD